MGLRDLSKRSLQRLFAPGLAGIEAAVGDMERALRTDLTPPSAVWSGTLAGGRALLPDGRVDRRAGAKYRDELDYWVTAKRRPHEVDLDDFDRVFTDWQGIRLADLRDFIGAASDAEFESWRHRQAVVELGSGPFPCIAATTWRRAVAVDPLADGYVREGLTPQCVHMHRVTFLAAAGERLPLPGASADLVVCENMLDHVDDPRAVLLEIRRILRPGGLLWLLVDLMEYADRMHPHSFVERKLRGAIAEARFETVRERVSDHHSHPKAFGELRALLARPGGRRDLPPAPSIVVRPADPLPENPSAHAAPG